MTEFSSEWNSLVRLNAPRNRRQRIGAWLRRVADRLDGRVSLSFEVSTSPPLPKARVIECLRCAFRAVKYAVESECQAHAEERVLRACKPALFEDA